MLCVDVDERDRVDQLLLTIARAASAQEYRVHVLLVDTLGDEPAPCAETPLIGQAGGFELTDTQLDAECIPGSLSSVSPFAAFGHAIPHSDLPWIARVPNHDTAHQGALRPYRSEQL